MATQEEINKLKENWESDPCWDIEDTEGFEAHHDELLAYHQAWRIKWEVAHAEKENARADKVRVETGVVDKYIVSALNTWNEIERMVSSLDRYIHEMGQVEDQVKIELMQAQIRATLLQAAQLKRIADTLEKIEGIDSLQETVRIWGSEK